jgi:RimJ/RimL family protein N-acetyltransferase
MKNYLVGSKIKLVKFYDRYMTPEYLNWLNDQRVNKYMNTGRFPVVKSNIYAPDGEKNLMFAVLSNLGCDSGEQLWQDNDFNYYIGTCSLHDIDWIVRKGEMGYMIGDKNYWGAGIATELIYLLTDYGFNRLNLNKITAGVVEENIGSIRALEKNGFKKYAISEQDYFSDSKMLNSYRFHKFQSWLGEENV